MVLREVQVPVPLILQVLLVLEVLQKVLHQVLQVLEITLQRCNQTTSTWTD
jgi:hypothetical protein